MILGIALGAVALLGLYVLALWAIMRHSLSPIRIPIYLSPGAMGMPQVDVSISKEGSSIPGWWVPAEGPDVAILLHGYMMNRSEMVPTAVWLARRGTSCLLFDFPAHGNHPERRTGLGWPERHDVLAACRWVRERNPSARVVLIGSSMGSAAAAFALAEDPLCADALILDSAYSRLDDAVNGWWLLLGGKLTQFLLRPVVWLSPWLMGFSARQVDVAEALKQSSVPVLVMHGEADLLADPVQPVRNLQALGDRGTMVWFPECRHCEGRWMMPDRFADATAQFLQAAEFAQPVTSANEAEAL